MPSLASYRRRKAEVERLTYDLIRAQDSNRYAIRYIEDLERALKYSRHWGILPTSFPPINSP